MDAYIAAINQFASLHPYVFAAATGIGGFCVRHWLFTRAMARRIAKLYFRWQRRQLEKLGKTDAEIDAIMLDEAKGLIAFAEEVKAEADEQAAETPPGTSAK